MERKLPKNIRQIGNVSDNPKVYVEDYVDTFITQMCEKASEVPVGAFLIGESFRKDEQDYIFIHGLVQMQDITMKGNEVILGDKTWKKACEEGKRYFAGNTILGWILIAPGLQLSLNTNLIKMHEKLFMKKSRMFIMKDSIEKDESFFVYKYNDLMQIGGHYIYYEKNPSMQDYMIANRKQNCVTPSEVFEDRATKNFRSIINNKEQQQFQRRKNRMSYIASTFLILMVLVIGVTGLNRYEKLEGVQASISDFVEGVFGMIPKGERQEVMAEVDSENLIYVNGMEETEGVETQSTGLQEGATQIPGIQGGDIQNTKPIDGVSESEEMKGQIKEETKEEIKEEIKDESEKLENDLNAQGDENVEKNPEVDSQENEQEKSEVQIDNGEEENKGEARTYTVKEGDTLAMISVVMYGTVKRADEISRYNGLEDVDYIYVGQVLYLP